MFIQFKQFTHSPGSLNRTCVRPDLVPKIFSKTKRLFTIPNNNQTRRHIMKITNAGVIQNLNGIARFIDAENGSNRALLSAKGEYAVNYNKNVLMGAYKPYMDTLERVKDDKDAIDSLLKEEIELEDMRKITEDDFRDGITLEVMQALEFMTI